MPILRTDGPYATFINTFHCRPQDQDDVVRLNIDIVEQVARHHDGFISATVHRSVDGSRVVNYLQWRTAADLHAMQRSPAFQRIARGLSRLVDFDPVEVVVTHVADGSGDET